MGYDQGLGPRWSGHRGGQARALIIEIGVGLGVTPSNLKPASSSRRRPRLGLWYGHVVLPFVPHGRRPPPAPDIDTAPAVVADHSGTSAMACQTVLSGPCVVWTVLSGPAEEAGHVDKAGVDRWLQAYVE